MTKLSCLILLFSFAAAAAQAPKFQLAGDQLSTLERDQKSVTKAYIEFQRAQQTLQSAQGKMLGDAERIKQANGWPADTAFRPDTLTFYTAPPKPAPLPVPAQQSAPSFPATATDPTRPRS